MFSDEEHIYDCGSTGRITYMEIIYKYIKVDQIFTNCDGHGYELRKTYKIFCKWISNGCRMWIVYSANKQLYNLLGIKLLVNKLRPTLLVHCICKWMKQAGGDIGMQLIAS